TGCHCHATRSYHRADRRKPVTRFPATRLSIYPGGASRCYTEKSLSRFQPSKIGREIPFASHKALADLVRFPLPKNGRFVLKRVIENLHCIELGSMHLEPGHEIGVILLAARRPKAFGKRRSL